MDLDQTLIDSMESIIQSFEQTFLHEFGRELSRDALMSHYGRPLRFQMAAMGGEEHADRLVEEYRRRLLALDHLILVYEGFPDVLAELRRRKYPLGIVTSKARTATDRHLRLYQLDQMVDIVVTADDTVHHKPDPEPFLLAARKLGVAPGRCLALGDSPWDILAANKAGMTSALAKWGLFDSSAFEREGAKSDLVLETPQHLLAICPPLGGLASS